MPDGMISRRNPALIGLFLSVALLIPGLFLPVITLRGTLDPVGVAALAPQLLEQGLSDSTTDALRPMINPQILPILEMAPGGLKGALVGLLGRSIGNSLSAGQPIEVYQQTRSILGSVKHLFQVGSWLPAALILLFSVLVPLTKAGMVTWALAHPDPATRHRIVKLVATIGKWSMADVFAVAIIISYLAASASTATPGSSSLVTFEATFGPGFYWFTAYCLVSLASQQATLKMLENG